MMQLDKEEVESSNPYSIFASRTATIRTTPNNSQNRKYESIYAIIKKSTNKTRAVFTLVDKFPSILNIKLTLN